MSLGRPVRAVIDVGTNSVKLLVAEVAGGAVRPLLELSRQTRLGRGFYETHQLLPAAIEQTAEAVRIFAGRARELGEPQPRVIATSAARDALNQEELLRAIEQRSGLLAEIISGQQEAEWAFQGVATDPQLGGQRLLLLDVGGGSSQFIIGENWHHTFRQSFPVGTVRLLERLCPQDPPTAADLAGCRAWLQDFFARQITPAVSAHLREPGKEAPLLLATGGTSTILARIEGGLPDFDRDRIEGMRLSRSQVLDRLVQLWSLSLEQRQQIVGLPPNRADVILMGVAIYEAVMERFRFAELRISTRGLRFGVLLA